MSERDDCWGIVFRWRSRYLPTRKLLKVLASHNVNIDDIDIGSPEIIRLRVKKAKKDYRAKEKQQPKGQLIKYADTEHTRQLRGWPTQYNSFVQSFSIGLPDSLEPANRSATSFYRVLPMHDGVITTVSERDRLKGVMEHEAERFLKSVTVV